MGEVVELIQPDDGCGYVMDGDNKITGIYTKNIAAMVEHGNTYLGAKGEDGVDDALLTTKQELTDFCIMWLAIFNPDVLKEDE